MGGFDVVALRAICQSYVDQMVIPVLTEVQQAQAEVRTQLQQLWVVVEEKAAAKDVPTLDRFESLLADVAQKALSTEDAIAKLQLKDSCHDNAIIAKLEERTANAERAVRAHAGKIAELRDVSQELQSKANIREVPTLAQFQKLSNTVAKKANSDKVPTLEQFMELQALAESKVSAHWVPSMQQFESLVAQVEKKANSTNVLKSIQEEMQQKANIKDIPRAAWIEEQLEKASTYQSTTQSSLDKLASVVEKKLAFLASRVQKNTEALDHFQTPSPQQAVLCYFPAPACGTWGPVSSSDQCGWSVQSQSDSSNSGGEGLAPGGWAEPQQEQQLA